MPSASIGVDTSPNRRRHNGWNWPLNPMQICSWILLSSLVIGAFIVSLPLPVYPVFQIIFVCGIFWIICCIVYSTSTDPGKGHKIIPVRFDRQKNAHVIEKGFCNICQLNVESGTKHCRKCNKCIPNFDHHCKWLNNCIGSKNYRSFLTLVGSLVFFSLFSFFFFGWSMIHFITTTTHDRPIPEVFSDQRLIFDIWNWFILNISVVIIFGVVFASTLHLLSFHIMLFFNNQTTFSYIVRQRKIQKQSTGAESVDQTQNSSKSLPTVDHSTSAQPQNHHRPNPVSQIPQIRVLDPLPNRLRTGEGIQIPSDRLPNIKPLFEENIV